MTRRPKHHGSGWTTSDDRKLRTLHERGLSPAEIATILGRSRPAIYQRLTTQRNGAAS